MGNQKPLLAVLMESFISYSHRVYMAEDKPESDLRAAKM